jgi:hypothetical protein
MLIQPLFFAALGAFPVHFALIYIVGQQQATAWTFLGARGADSGTATWQRADKNRLAGTAPVLAFFFFLTDRAFFHE